MHAPVGVTYRSLEKGEPHFRALSEVGIPFVGITPEKPRTLDGVAGLLVTGGPDIDPRLYGQDPWAETDGPPDRERDALELQLIREAQTSDGVIEAIELPSKTSVLGCQWHPEERLWTSPGDRKIFEAFLGALS